MRYSVEIRKFFYSQYFFGGLRIAVGISLPAVLCLLVFHNTHVGFTMSTGALGACAVDMPGPLKYKRNDMLACSAIGFLSAFATGLATIHPVTLWCTLVALTFVLSLIVVYGNRWPQISFAALFMMIVTLDAHFTPWDSLVNAAWILAGGLWYTVWATFVSRLLASRIERQVLAENAFACADYLRARARFFDLHEDLDECYRNLVNRQIVAVERQDAARDIVLRNLPKLRRGKLDAQRTQHFNLFINTVDLHEVAIGTHTDYSQVRRAFGNSALPALYRDLILKAAADLENIGLAVLQNQAPQESTGTKADLQAIERELLRNEAIDPEAYAAMSASLRRVWSITRLIEKMRRILTDDTAAATAELRPDAALQRFVTERHISLKPLFSNLTMASPGFRHAVRVTITVAVGFLLGRVLLLTNSYWLVMTSVIILKPGYSLTRQRNTERIIGTLIGCTAALALIFGIHQPRILLVVMFASMVMSYSLMLFNYTTSVVFMSIYVLIMFHLLAPDNLRIIGARATDTVIGCLLAIAASHLFPYWEYRFMGDLVDRMIVTMRQYLEASCWWWSGRKISVSASGTPFDVALDPDFNYRLTRKNVHIAFANLGQAFQRMMIEPKFAQKFVPELNDLLIRSHVLTSQITSTAPLLRTPVYRDASNPDDGNNAILPRALCNALSCVRENLLAAQTRAALPADQAAITKRLTRELDAMVVAAEHTVGPMVTAAQDLKLLAHQCKQMLAASWLIRKDASLIQLPQE